MRFSVTTLGCKVNQYDGCAIAEALHRAGLLQAGQSFGCEPPAEVVVVNTCCVTTAAMRKSRQAIRRAARSAPAACILVTGCHADYDPAAIAALLSSLHVPPGQAIIAGHHADLAGCLAQVVRLAGTSCSVSCSGGSAPVGEGPGAGCIGSDRAVSVGTSAAPATPQSIKARRDAAVKNKAPGTRALPPPRHFPGRQRAFVKVQDGCDAFCSYCVVPYTRPVLWWRGMEDVEAQCRRLVAAGHKEIVLCGVFLGAYGQNTAMRQKWNGPSLLPQIIARVAAIKGLWRLRLSSLECNDVTEDLLATCLDRPNVAPHFHLPLQSGSDRILLAMNRQYSVGQFHECLDRIRRRLDRPAITTDIIVGFPGESQEDFAATLAAARKAGFSRIHAFPFSPIPGTAAWTRRHDCPPPAVVKARMAELTSLGNRLARDFRRQFIGETLEVLAEDRRSGKAGWREGLSERYLSVRFKAPALQPGDVAAVRIDRCGPTGLLGRLAGAP